MEELLAELNESQQEAVVSTEGFIRVIAGAGSGKTRALTHRYAFIVNELGVDPSNILSVTFTNKAAHEMRRRVKKLIGGEQDTGFITTYHGFCVRVLREDIHRLFYPKNFIILDVEDQKILLREIFEDMDLKMNDKTFKRLLDKIGILKGKHSLRTANDFARGDAFCGSGWRYGRSNYPALFKETKACVWTGFR